MHLKNCLLIPVILSKDWLPIEITKSKYELFKILNLSFKKHFLMPSIIIYNNSHHFKYFYYLFDSLLQFFPILLILQFIPTSCLALTCYDCVGKDCMGSKCKGDYCMIVSDLQTSDYYSRYAPRWGTMVWGCLSGRMIKNDLRSHCEVLMDKNSREEDEAKKPFTCFCDNRDYCNKISIAERLEKEKVKLYTCICKGTHCKDAKKCVGELCTYVINRKTNEVEQGCVNASVPLIERRSAGACAMPPITGAMHHTLAKVPDDLLYTESCACEGNNCNSKKPKIRVPEKSKCEARVEVEVMGQNMISKNNATCTGEFCFKVKIRSKIGHMTNYLTTGCASFDDKAILPEELKPTGSASFFSENLDIEAHFRTFDKEAVSRHKSRSKGNKKTKSHSRSEEKNYEEEEEDEENEDLMNENEWEDEEEKKEKEENEFKEQKTEEKTQHYIIEKPTFGPELNESTNSTLISVFVLLILLILLSGVVWKFQLHKRLFRASYDSVAVILKYSIPDIKLLFFKLFNKLTNLRFSVILNNKILIFYLNSEIDNINILNTKNVGKIACGIIYIS
ncbi:hypothetical protein Mgra_00001411 [Meloidogyne graminicola]|uniref:Activin_recp domain-containing protein n=1 Tax=Meloidogyne graminicola TaxID=189291 RepID=A0A8T0A0V8_9BILA|nr:hypothetical protein Mgra_00001411 [Meloidogyne graminicola]